MALREKRGDCASAGGPSKNRIELYNMMSGSYEGGSRGNAGHDGAGQMLPLVFNHIQKSAGTSLRHALARSINASEVVVGMDRWIFGEFDDFASVSPAFRALVADGPEALPPSPHLVAGHYAVSTTRARYPNAPHMTVLREARSRLISHWLFWRSHTDDWLQGTGTWADYVRKSTASLVDFIEDPALAVQVDNVALRILLWPHPLIPAAGHIPDHADAQLLMEAKARIDAFDHVDIVENPRFEENLSRWLRTPLVMERLNETMPMPESRRTSLARELTPAAVMALARRTRLDDALWRYVAGRRLPSEEVEGFREASYAQAIARHALLMGQ